MRTFNLDNRGLEPPEPMVRILDMVKQLDNGDEIHAIMDREPFLLYPELERRGLEWEFRPDAENYLLTVRRPAAN